MEFMLYSQLAFRSYTAMQGRHKTSNQTYQTVKLKILETVSFANILCQDCPDTHQPLHS